MSRRDPRAYIVYVRYADGVVRCYGPTRSAAMRRAWKVVDDVNGLSHEAWQPYERGDWQRVDLHGVTWLTSPCHRRAGAPTHTLETVG